MSRLEELIAELCPDGVEYKKLGDVATITRGGNFQKKDYVENGVPCIHYGQIYTQYGLFINETISFISEEKAKKQKMANTNDIIMAVTSENIDDVCKCVAWLGEGEIAVSGHTAIIKHSLNPKYLVYYLHSMMFYKQKTKLAQGTKVIEVTPSKLVNIIIPVPPLPVQSEIVRILDKFTELTAELSAELTAELTARKKQYEYYRDNLLNYGENEVKLDDIAKFSYGYTDKAKEHGNVRFIRITDINSDGYLKKEDAKYLELNDANKKYLVKTGDLLMARTGATYGKTLYVIEENPAIYASFLIKIELNNDVILNRFYWHFSKSNLYWNQANKLVTTGGQPQFNANALKQIIIPVPSLEEQARIVAILDRFDALCNDISTELPAEIEARQKQYEYYRDKLLTFKDIS